MRFFFLVLKVNVRNRYSWKIIVYKVVRIHSSNRLFNSLLLRMWTDVKQMGTRQVPSRGEHLGVWSPKFSNMETQLKHGSFSCRNIASSWNRWQQILLWIFCAIMWTSRGCKLEIIQKTRVEASKKEICC